MKMQYISKKDIKLPKRNKSSKKGDNGRVLVLGGSQNYIGAVGKGDWRDPPIRPASEACRASGCLSEAREHLYHPEA